MTFKAGERARLTCGRWRGREVEIVETLEARVEIIINGVRFERTTYRVLMPHGEIWSVLPDFLERTR